MTNMHKKIKADEIKATVKDGFYLYVDGKKYGPFLEEHRTKYKNLNHLCGCKLEPVRLSTGWVEPAIAEKKPTKDKGMPLLDGLDFKPTPKVAKW